MIRLSIVLCALICALVVWLIIDISAANGDTTQPFPIFLNALEEKSQHDQQRIAQLQRRVRFEHRRFVVARHRSRVLLRTLMSRPSVVGAIDLACTIYGSCSTLHRRARCESGYNPNAQNASGASGLFQFIYSTWRSTPFGGFSVFDPYANALAAGWMQAHGRGGEWVCR